MCSFWGEGREIQDDVVKWYLFCFLDDSADEIPEHNEFLFPEYEILIEPEEPEFPADSTDDEQGADDTSKDTKEQEELGAAGTAGQK